MFEWTDKFKETRCTLNSHRYRFSGRDEINRIIHVERLKFHLIAGSMSLRYHITYSQKLINVQIIVNYY